MRCRKVCMPPIMHPPICYTHHTHEVIEVPHIHPVHHEMIQHQLFEHKHYFPQSQSFQQSVSNQQFTCSSRFQG